MPVGIDQDPVDVFAGHDAKWCGLPGEGPECPDQDRCPYLQGR